jgi:lysophospholipid acyltransferase (LPLAT)-like uncharacterized protein
VFEKGEMMVGDKNLVSEPPAAMSKKKKISGVIVPHSPKWYQRLAAWVLWAVFGMVSATLRYRLHDPHQFMTRKDIRQVIFCTWHNRLALSMKLNFFFRLRHHKTAGLAGLVSTSKDGAFLAAVLKRFSVQPVRGSSSRRGSQALLELTTWLERGYDVAITPDGPRGPCYVVQDGVMSLAQVTGFPIVPASYYLQWKIQLKSWDRFQIPLPFSRCDIYTGHVLTVPRDISDADRETLRKQLEDELKGISKD